MLSQILPGLFQSKLPFPENPLKDINVYIIRDGERTLLVDNGMDLEETRRELQRDLRELKIDLAKTRFFITHSHPDHCSNTTLLAGPESVIYLGQADIKMLNYGNADMQARVLKRNTRMGVPEGDFFQDNNLKPVHPMRELAVRRDWRFESPVNGDVITAGDYAFTCLQTPGHSPGHLCLYEPAHKVLLCGDHILQKVTPVILPDDEEDNPLAEYLDSLEEVGRMDINLALPAHRGLIHGVKERINSIKQHHRARLDEIRGIIDGGYLNTYQIAGRMHWDVNYPAWEDFPIWQRMIASSEAESHLRYLTLRGEIIHRMEGSQAFYTNA